VRKIRRVAVLGAGVMGATIAAHCANAGLRVDLLDITPTKLTPEEEKEGLSLDSRQVRDRVVRGGFERMLGVRPAALMSGNFAARIRLGNFEDHFDRVAEADWVLEAIIERLEPKRHLMERVEKLAKEGAIISSNTSGIPLHQVAEGRSAGFKRRFLGTHFFNPPRYLKLLELIPTGDTDPEVVEYMRSFAERILGKGVVIAKDTPNFIGSRLGNFALLRAVGYAVENGYGIEEVDAITGPLIGHPKTATFRLNDQVGIDLAIEVTKNRLATVPDGEAREEIKPHPILERMQERNLLGNKTGAGFYKRDKRDGKTVFDVLNPETFEHEPAKNPEVPIAREAQRQGDLGARLRFLIQKADEDRHARYIRDTLLPYMAYASRRVPEISDTLEDVDHAMEWGFAHQTGPFRTWDLLGVRETVERMDALGIEVGPWVREMLDGGNGSFYRTEDGCELQFSPISKQYEPVRQDPMYVSLDRLREEGGELARNDSASLLDLGDGVLCLEFHSKGNAINSETIEMGHRALVELQKNDWVGLAIGNEGRNFCGGADLRVFNLLSQEGSLQKLDQMIVDLHRLLLSLRRGAKPVVAAPRGQTLGGGLEVCLHADRIVAAGETYMGLVEAGVGLIPAGGGTKEMARRVVSRALKTAPNTPALPFLQKAFETIAMAKVSASAIEARELGFLDEDDRIVMNADHLIHAAKREVLDLADGYAPPERDHNVYAGGITARSALVMGIRTLQWGRYASEYDGVIAGHVARVLTGGDLTLPQWVTEEHLLALEKEAFLSLLANEKTHQRIEAMLKTGKPLRN